MKKYALLLSAGLLALTACSKSEPSATADSAPAAATAAAEEKVLNFYNWPDYISKDMIANFEKETGIKVNYDTFENNEALQAKLVAGSTGFDIVVPGSAFIQPQIEAGLLQPLDRSKIVTYGNLDADLMQSLTSVDPGNQYSIPWAWGFTTVGINAGKVKKALGSTPMPDNAWDLVFNPTYTSKLKSCGIAYLDSPTEILPPALMFLGKDAYSADAADHKAAGEMLAKVRPHVKIFSSTMIDDLSTGRACAVIGWSGDINIARDRAIENKSNQDIQALLPTGGALPFFDLMAIPKDAKHPQNAHAFISYFLRPEVSATLTNELNYPTANKAASANLNPAIAENKTIFPAADYMAAKFVPPKVLSNETRQSMSDVYTQFKKGK